MAAEATEKLWQILQYVKHNLLIWICRLRKHNNFCLEENLLSWIRYAFLITPNLSTWPTSDLIALIYFVGSQDNVGGIVTGLRIG